MFKHLLMVASLIPVTALCEPTHMNFTTPESPRLTSMAPAARVTMPIPPPVAALVPPGDSRRRLFVIPPNGGALTLKPGLRLSPLEKAPGSNTPPKTVPPAVPAPAPQRAPARQLVFREDDKAATKVVHPLLTQDVPVSVYH